MTRSQLALTLFLGCASAGCGGSTPSRDTGADLAIEARYEVTDTQPAPPDGGDAAEPDGWWTGLAPAGEPVRTRLGVSSHLSLRPEENADRDFELTRLAELGDFRVRTDFLWEWLEPAPGQFDFEAVATGVERIRAAGGRITAILAYGVGWAMPDGTPGSIDPAVYAAFAGATAARFCGQIDQFEVWNEPNLDTFWPPEADAARYALLLTAAHAAVKHACPGARVLVGGQSSADADLDNGWRFLKALGAALPGVCDAFDVLAIHPYTNDQAWSPERDAYASHGYVMPGQAAMTALARERLADWGCPAKPVAFTEMGWPSYEVSETDQGRWLARSVLLALRDGVEVYDWYTFWDGEPVTTGPRPHESYFGLFGWSADPMTPRREKPAWRALKALADTLGSARFAGDVSARLGLPDDVLALAFVRSDGALVLAAWDGRDQPDLGVGASGEGGPDTTFALSLPVPAGTSAVEIVDLEGSAIEPRHPAPIGALTLVLSPAVRYVVFERTESEGR